MLGCEQEEGCQCLLQCHFLLSYNLMDVSTDAEVQVELSGDLKTGLQPVSRMSVQGRRVVVQRTATQLDQNLQACEHATSCEDQIHHCEDMLIAEPSNSNFELP